MDSRIARAIVGGALGTFAMTAVGLWIAPMMGMPAMNPADMLAGQMGGSAVLGWAGHLTIGIVLAIIYAVVVLDRLSGPAAVRGALFSLAPWLLAQIVVMPMMGMGLFSGSPVMAGGSLIGHLVYGSVLGGVTGAPAAHGATEDTRAHAATR